MREESDTGWSTAPDEYMAVPFVRLHEASIRPRSATRTLPWRQVEVHRNNCFHFDGFSIEEIRFVAPLLHRIRSRGNKVRMAGNCLHIPDPPLPVNDDLQPHLALDAVLLGLVRILRQDLVRQVALGHVWRDPNPVQSQWFDVCLRPQ